MKGVSRWCREDAQVGIFDVCLSQACTWDNVIKMDSLRPSESVLLNEQTKNDSMLLSGSRESPEGDTIRCGTSGHESVVRVHDTQYKPPTH